MSGLVDQALAVAQDPKHTKWICPLLLVGDAVLTAGVIWKIPYTEIDWRAYMQQVESYLSGQRNYAKITGSTGPLVYPAGHVYIYRLLHAATTSGTDIPAAQIFFALLYLSTLGLVMLCYRRAGVPPYIFPLLVLSKRLHSVYVLRLFNDCWAVFFSWLAVYLFQSGLWRAGAMAYSFGVSVKMSVLLVLPAVGVLLFLAQGAGAALGTAAVMLQYQVLLAWPFLSKYPMEYLGRAFEFGRVFEWKWTVNWRFVGKEVFLKKEFATGLLVAHISLLGFFVLTRWLRPADMTLPEVVKSVFQPLSQQKQQAIAAKVTPEFILTSVLTANAIGMLCARTLHYQFYSWLAWGTPYLLWRSGWHPAVQYGIWFSQEVAWNIYPSSVNSSTMVVVWLAVQVAGIWIATEARPAPPEAPVAASTVATTGRPERSTTSPKEGRK